MKMKINQKNLKIFRIPKSKAFRDKKAHFFAVGLVLVMIIVIVAAVIGFGRDTKKSETSLDILLKTQDAYMVRNISSQFAIDSASLSAQQTFQRIANLGGVFGSCSVDTIGEVKYVVWNKDCNPNTDTIKEKFQENVQMTFDNFLKTNPDIAYSLKLNNNVLSATSKAKKTVDVSSGSINLHSEYTPSFSIDLNSLGIYFGDFESLYSSVKNCNRKVECIKELDLKRWKISDVSEVEGKVIINITTQKIFFYSEKEASKYSPVTMSVEV
jgi:hypothetical protein